MVFMATPHKGSVLAKSLKRVFKILGIATSDKQYVDELVPYSKALENMNVRFKELASTIHIVSFYERLKTKIGLWKKV